MFASERILIHCVCVSKRSKLGIVGEGDQALTSASTALSNVSTRTGISGV